MPVDHSSATRGGPAVPVAPEDQGAAERAAHRAAGRAAMASKCRGPAAPGMGAEMSARPPVAPDGLYWPGRCSPR
jgi:hypothetical protein